MSKALPLVIITLIIIGVVFYCASLIPSKIIKVKNLLTASIEQVEVEEIVMATGTAVYLPDFSKIKEDFLKDKISFLEIHLSEMKTRLYQKGEIKKEADILLKGDPDGWGGTADGLYKIMSGNRIGFSVVANVYLPFSLKFYGKYYIHGEPYYKHGGKLISDVSGGCLRLADEDAEDIYEMTEVDMPVVVIDKPNDGFQYKEPLTKFPWLSAQGYLVADLDSGYVFSQKNAGEQFQIASITKLMTATVIAEQNDLRESITINEKMLEAYGATEGMEEDKSFRVVELFYPLLIESSNDAAEALSFFLGKTRFIELMNEKAKAILMQKTEFVDPSGYDPRNLSTAQDLFYLARYILNNRPPILEITRGKRVTDFGKDIAFDLESFWNKNVFTEDPTFVGGKTGFIKTSKDTALFIFRLKTSQGEERNIVIILLRSGDKKLDTQRSYIWLLKNYFQ